MPALSKSVLRAFRSHRLQSTNFIRVANPATMATVSDAVTKDHRELKDYYNEVVSSDDPDHKQRYGNQFVWELARHAVGEELVIYPAFEDYLGAKGKEMAEEDRAEHRRVKEELKEFQKMDSTQPEFEPKLKKIWSILSDHIDGEEKNDLPALEDALKDDPGQSEDLAASFESTKAFAPSRAHPSAGEHPPFETVMGLLTAPIDRLSDLFRRFPKDRDTRDTDPADPLADPADPLSRPGDPARPRPGDPARPADATARPGDPTKRGDPPAPGDPRPGDPRPADKITGEPLTGRSDAPRRTVR
ncbi:hypothetical protein F5Y18DRAFT_93137 [Xylariaceae sp. FL1019]|nr:hypothetical protein F5Y18DRAFT_93137 [Xylariaceae sp. FL1019]